MARNADGFDVAFLLGVGEHIHDRAEIRRPGAGLHAVHEQRVQVGRPQFLPKPLDVGLGHFGGGGASLRLNEQLVTRDALKGVAEIDMRAVLVGGVEIGDALFKVGVADQLAELFVSEPHLVGGMIDADRAGAHADKRGLDAAAAKRDLVCAAFELARVVGSPDREVRRRQSAHRCRRLPKEITTG